MPIRLATDHAVHLGSVPSSDIGYLEARVRTGLEPHVPRATRGAQRASLRAFDYALLFGSVATRKNPAQLELHVICTGARAASARR